MNLVLIVFCKLCCRSIARVVASLCFISVLPEYAPLRQFVVLRHHVMIGCDRLYVHIQRVQASFADAEILGLNLTSLAYADMAK